MRKHHCILNYAFHPAFTCEKESQKRSGVMPSSYRMLPKDFEIQFWPRMETVRKVQYKNRSNANELKK